MQILKSRVQAMPTALASALVLSRRLSRYEALNRFRGWHKILVSLLNVIVNKSHCNSFQFPIILRAIFRLDLNFGLFDNLYKPSTSLAHSRSTVEW